MKVLNARTVFEDVFGPVRNWQDMYIVLESHLPFGFCLDDNLSDQEAKEILVEAGRSYEVQKAIIAKVKDLLAAAGHEVDWEG